MAIRPAYSTAPYKVYGDGVGKFLNTAQYHNAKVYFFEDRIDEYHLWHPRDILIYHVAMSNELFDRISRLGGIKTIETLEIEEV